MSKLGRPKIETEVALGQACVDAGHPLTLGEMGDRVGLDKRTVQRRVNADPGEWRRTEGRQPRFYPDGWTPLLVPDELEAEFRQRIEEHQQAES